MATLIKGHGRRNFVFCLFAFSLAVNFTFLLLQHSLTDLEPEPSVFQGKPKTRCSLGIPQVFAARLGKGSYSVHGLNKYWILCLFLWERPLLDYLDLILQANLINTTLTFPYNYTIIIFYCTHSVPLENLELFPWEAQLIFYGNSYKYAIYGFSFDLAGEILQFLNHT